MTENEKCVKNSRVVLLLLKVTAVVVVIAIVLAVGLGLRERGNNNVVVPGILSVYAYDLSTGIEIDQQEGYDLAASVVTESKPWFSGMNAYYGLPLTLKVTDERLEGMALTFDVRVDHGSFYGDIKNDKYKNNPEDRVASLKDADLGQRFAIENGESIFWHDDLIRDEATEAGVLPQELMSQFGNVIYADVIIKADDRIVGYTVIEIHYNEGLFTASIGGTAVYLQEDGSFLETTDERVQQEIAKSKELQK
jgi:hypothetical protein